MMTGTNYIWRQVFATMGSGFSEAGLMAIWALSSVKLGEIEEENGNPDSQGQLLTPEQFSWFASLPLLLGIPGSSLGGILTEYFGPRKFQLIMTPLLTVAVITMRIASWSFFKDIEWASTIILMTRTVQSLCVGAAQSVICQYPCEIADSQKRGFLGGLQEFWNSSGFVLCYLLGYFLHWTQVMWVLPLLTFIPGFFFLLVSPESPVWLHKKGKRSEAFEVLELLRSSKKDVEVELRKMDEEQGGSVEINCKQFLHLLQMKSNFKPLVISSVVILFHVLSGALPIGIFMVNILRAAGVDLHPNLGSSIVGSVRIFCSLFGALLLNYFPRKRILISGIITVAISNCLLGVSYLLLDYDVEFDFVNWLPLAMLIVFSIGFSLGIGPAAWLVAAEILPNAIRSVGYGIVLTLYSLAAFISLKTFSFLLEFIGMYGIFWFYSICSFLYALFVMFIVPETKGLTLKEIEGFWKGSIKINSTSNIKSSSP